MSNKHKKDPLQILNTLLDRFGRFLQRGWTTVVDNIDFAKVKSSSSSFLGLTFVLVVQYIKEALRLTPEFLIIVLAGYSRFWVGNAPILPILPDFTWWSGLTSMSYISAILYSYGLCMQEFQTKEGETYRGNQNLFPVLVLIVLDAFALWAGTPEIVVIPLSLVFLSVLMVHGYSEQGKYGVLPLARYPLIVVGLWIAGLGEFRDAELIKASLKQVSGQEWGSLLIFALAFFLITFGGGIWSGIKTKQKVQSQVKNGG